MLHSCTFPKVFIVHQGTRNQKLSPIHKHLLAVKRKKCAPLSVGFEPMFLGSELDCSTTAPLKTAGKMGNHAHQTLIRECYIYGEIPHILYIINSRF